MIDQILQRLGLKYEDLKPAERETLSGWLSVLEKGELTSGHIKGYVSAMRDAVEVELVGTANGSREDIFLKARLRNYMLLEAFLTTPEKAKQNLERAIAGLVPSK